MKNDPFWCTRCVLKLELTVPFVLADGGGAAGAFGQSLVVALCLGVVNTTFEWFLAQLPNRRKRFVVSGVLGLIIVAVYSALLVWWKSQEMLRNPIAMYGIGN